MNGHRPHGRLAAFVDFVLGILLRPRLRRVLRWSFVVTLPAGALLLRERGLDAAVGIVILELCAFVTVLVVALRLGGERREMILDLVMHPAVRRVLHSEMRIVATLPVAALRALRRRDRRGDEAGYAGGNNELAVALALTPVVLAETAAVHLLLPDGLGVVKIALLLVSLYSLLWLVSWAVGLRAFPHRVIRGELRARLGQLYEARVPLDAITATEVRPEVVGRRTELVLADGRAAMAVGGRVALHFEMARPVTVNRPFGEPVRVTKLSIAVDDPAALVERVGAQRHAAPAPTVTGQGQGRGGSSCRSLEAT